MIALHNRKQAKVAVKPAIKTSKQNLTRDIDMMYNYLQADHTSNGERIWDLYTLGRIHALVHRIVTTTDLAYREILPHERQPLSKRKEAQFCKTSELADEAFDLTRKLIRIPEGHVVTPYVTAYFQTIHALADQQLFFTTTMKDGNTITSKEQFNLLFTGIRERVRQKYAKLKADLDLLRETRVIRSLMRYLERIFYDAEMLGQSLLIMRIDLAYNPLFHSEISPTQIFRDVHTLLNVRRHQGIFDGLAGYACIPFYGEASGSYAHLTLIFRQSAEVDEQDIRAALDHVWSKITKQKGGVYSCILREQAWKHVCQGLYSTYDFNQLEPLKDALAHLYRTAHLMPPVAFAGRRMLRTGKFKPQMPKQNSQPWEFDHD